MGRNGILSLFLCMLIILACFATSEDAMESDISCLRSIKESLDDPSQIFSSWNFNNNSEGFICRFYGVECWNPVENRVISIQLPNKGLRGPFPMGITKCSSVLHLDLSGNYLSGSIPSNLANDLPYIISLDLSDNNLSGPIPPSTANGSFINTLKLNNNHLTGQIPQELSELQRLTIFSVANNNLSGPIPIFSGIAFPADSYANNKGLCGRPLKVCKDDLDGLFLSGFAIGFPIFTLLTTLFMLLRSPKLSISNMYSYLHPIKKTRRKHQLIPRSLQMLVSEEISSQNREVKSSVALSLSCNFVFSLQVTDMEKYIRRLSLMQLKRATNNFDNKQVIGYGKMGVMYKGVFHKDFSLAVKRIHKFESFENEFLSIIEILGRLQHTNLVPLQGFCYEGNKKFLVYKYMSNGTLHQWLHSKPQVEGKKMGWTLRFKIAKGVAQGLAWLHHNKVLRVAHLKISSKCILLDENFEPKISNFGNAHMMVNASGNSSSSCNFVAPDLSLCKEDVYRFGVLLLELITGKEPSLRESNEIDECIMRQGFDEEIYRTLKIAEDCIQANNDGTTSMLQVYQAMCSVGIPRNKICNNSCTYVEDNEV